MSSLQRWPLRPSVILGFLPVVACVVYFIGRLDESTKTDLLSGELTDDVIVQTTVERLILIAVLLAVAAGYGWLAPTVRERRVRLRRWSRWPWVPVVVAFILCIVGAGFAAVDILDQSRGVVTILILFLAMNLCIGVFEETLFRGVLVVGLRRRLSEIWVLVVSSVSFGLIHLVNALGSQSLEDSVVQVVYATVIGAALYGLRRMSGGLLLPILLHAAVNASGAAGGLALIPILALAVGSVFIALRDGRTNRDARSFDDVSTVAAAA